MKDERKMEEMLHESEERTRAILKATTDSLALLDCDGNILILNEVTAERHGKRADELVGICVYDILPADLAAFRKAKCEEVVRSKKSSRFEDERDRRVFDNSLYPVFDEEGEVVAIAVYARDITEHRGVEKTLRKSEGEFRGLVENAPIGIYRTTSDGRILMVNSALVQMLGYASSEELIQRNLEEEGYHPDYPRSEFKRRIDSEGKILALESAWKGKDGTYVYVRESARAVFDENGKPLFYEGMVEDITEQKQAEDALRKSEERYRTLFESTLDGIATVNLEGFITECNQAYADILGYSRDELMKITYQNLTPSKWHAFNEKIFQQVMERGYSDVFEKEYIRKDGTTFPVSLHSWRIDDKDSKPIGVGSIVRDITERKRVEEALRESEKRLLEQNVQLQEKNIALRQIMEQVSSEKEEVMRHVQANVDQLLLPALEKLRVKDLQLDKSFIDLLENNLERLTSSFGSKISMKMHRLTQREIEICDMIMNGLSSKEIARLLNISYRSVETHRNNIRRKLGITNKKINLATYLKALHNNTP